MTDVFTKEKRSEVMSRIRGKWTKQERSFYEEHPEADPHPKLPYSPDFLLDGRAVFLDSSFWHGHVSKDSYEGMTPYWKDKLLRNIIRDECADSFWSLIGFDRI